MNTWQTYEVQKSEIISVTKSLSHELITYSNSRLKNSHCRVKSPAPNINKINISKNWFDTIRSKRIA